MSNTHQTADMEEVPMSAREANSGDQSDLSLVAAVLTTQARTPSTSVMSGNECNSLTGMLTDPADILPKSTKLASTSYNISFSNSHPSSTYDINHIDDPNSPPRRDLPLQPPNSPVDSPKRSEDIRTVYPTFTSDGDLLFLLAKPPTPILTMEAAIATTIARLEMAPYIPSTPYRTLNDEYNECYLTAEPSIPKGKKKKKKKVKKTEPTLAKKECYGLGFCRNYVCDHSKTIDYNPTSKELDAKRKLINVVSTALEQTGPDLKVSERMILFYLITYKNDVNFAKDAIIDQIDMRYNRLMSTGRINVAREVAFINARPHLLSDKIHKPALYRDDQLRYMEMDDETILDVRARQWSSEHGKKLKARYRSNYPEEVKMREESMQLHLKEGEIREQRQAYFELQKTEGLSGTDLDANMAAWDVEHHNTDQLSEQTLKDAELVERDLIKRHGLSYNKFPEALSEEDSDDAAASEQASASSLEVNTPEWYEENLNIFTEEYVEMHNNGDGPVFTLKPGEVKPVIYHPNQMASLPQCLQSWAPDFETYLKELYMELQKSDGETEASTGPPECNLFTFCQLFTALLGLEDEDLAILASQIRDDDYMTGHHHTIALLIRGMTSVNREYGSLIKVPRPVETAIRAIIVRSDLERESAAARKAKMAVRTPQLPKRTTDTETYKMNGTGEALTYISAWNVFTAISEAKDMVEIFKFLTSARGADIVFKKLDEFVVCLEGKVMYLEACIRLSREFAIVFDHDAKSRIIIKQNLYDEHLKRIETKDYDVKAVTEEGMMIVNFPEKSGIPTTNHNQVNFTQGESSNSQTTPDHVSSEYIADSCLNAAENDSENSKAPKVKNKSKGKAKAKAKAKGKGKEKVVTNAPADHDVAPRITRKPHNRTDTLWLNIMKDSVMKGTSEPSSAEEIEALRQRVEESRKRGFGSQTGTSSAEEDSADDGEQPSLLASFQHRINGGRLPAVKSYFTEEKKELSQWEMVKYMARFDQSTLAFFKESHIKWVGICGEHPIFTAQFVTADEAYIFLGNVPMRPEGEGYNLLMVCELVSITGNSGLRAAAFFDEVLVLYNEYCRQVGLVGPTWELVESKICDLCVWMWNRFAILARAHLPDKKFAASQHDILGPILGDEIPHVISGLVEIGIRIRDEQNRQKEQNRQNGQN